MDEPYIYDTLNQIYRSTLSNRNNVSYLKRTMMEKYYYPINIQNYKILVKKNYNHFLNIIKTLVNFQRICLILKYYKNKKNIIMQLRKTVAILFYEWKTFK